MSTLVWKAGPCTGLDSIKGMGSSLVTMQSLILSIQGFGSSPVSRLTASPCGNFSKYKNWGEKKESYAIFQVKISITDEESDAFTELIAHTVIYVSLYRYQEGMSTARSRMDQFARTDMIAVIQYSDKKVRCWIDTSSQITDEESDAFTELIAHTVIYVSLYRYQEGMSTARSRMDFDTISWRRLWE
ncbi:hypothetical protein LguiA_003665 [Lonicera macranthoides]